MRGQERAGEGRGGEVRSRDGGDGKGGKEGEGWGGDSSTVYSICVMEGPLCSGATYITIAAKPRSKPSNY